MKDNNYLLVLPHWHLRTASRATLTYSSLLLPPFLSLCPLLTLQHPQINLLLTTSTAIASSSNLAAPENMTDLCCCMCVRTNNVAIVEQLGAFVSVRGPGLSCKLPCIQSVDGGLSLKG